MMIKAIIFDLGGVIVDLDFTNFYNSIITQSPLNKPQTPIILEFFRQSDIYHQGLISDEEFYKLACDLLQVCELDQSMFFSAFNSIISGFNAEVVDLLKHIKEINKFKIISDKILTSIKSNSNNESKDINIKIFDENSNVVIRKDDKIDAIDRNYKGNNDNSIEEKIKILDYTK